MIFDHRNLLIVGSAALLGLVACEKNQSSDQTQTTGATRENPQNQPQTTPNQPTFNQPQTGTNTGTGMAASETKDPNDATIDRITDARCKRELACNNVGNGKKYNDEAACKRELRQNTHSDLRQSECKTVLTDKVQSCIDAIQNEKCDSVFELSRVNACRKGNLCKD